MEILRFLMETHPVMSTLWLVIIASSVRFRFTREKR
jgi:hypothetical protein